MMLLLATPVPPAASAAVSLGINLAGPADWNSELPFVDVFRMSRRWISQREGAGWGQGPDLALDASGYVKRLAPGCFAETPILTDLEGHYPAGDYTIVYRGKGRITFSGAAKVKSSVPGRLVATFDPTRGGVFVQLRETDPADPVHKIQVLLPGYDPATTPEFHPAFLKRWHGVSAFRFMDWMQTNGSEVSTWADRPKATDATWSERGIPVATMVRLCNLQKADGWFNIPHRATDEYVAQFATYVAKNLAPGRRAYVEWSNEVWNTAFSQHRYAAEQGAKRGLGTDEFHNAWSYTARRSVEVFKIWQRAFKGRNGLVRVLAAQAGWDEPAKQILAFEDAGHHADMLAIAPYFGLGVGPGTKPSQPEVSSWSVDQVLDQLQNVSIPESAATVQTHLKLAKQYGLRLACYEAGQGAVGIQGGENDERLSALLQNANRHRRMDAITRRYLSAIAPGLSGPIMEFSSVGKYSKWGSWGAAEYYDQARTPKLDGLRAWAAGRGQTIGR